MRCDDHSGDWAMATSRNSFNPRRRDANLEVIGRDYIRVLEDHWTDSQFVLFGTRRSWLSTFFDDGGDSEPAPAERAEGNRRRGGDVGQDGDYGRAPRQSAGNL